MLKQRENGNPSNLVDLPAGTTGSVMIDFGDGYDCLFDIPDPEEPRFRIYVETGVTSEMVELVPPETL
jgi:hypothetical protein